MAGRVLEGLPARIRDALGTAYGRGHDAAAARLGGMRTAKAVLEREIGRDQAEPRRPEGAIAMSKRDLSRTSRFPRPDPGPKPLRNHERLAAALAARHPSLRIRSEQKFSGSF